MAAARFRTPSIGSLFPACCFGATAIRLRTRLAACSLPPGLSAAGKIIAYNPLSAPLSRLPTFLRTLLPLGAFTLPVLSSS